MAGAFANSEAELTTRIKNWVGKEFGREHLTDLTEAEFARVMYHLSQKEPTP